VLIRMPGHLLDGAKAKVKRRGSTGWTLELLEERGEAYPVGTTVNAGAGECVLDAEAPAKAKREPKPAGEKQLSALDAAAKVLEERGQPMNTRQLIEVMAQKGYWTSPGGKTPWATLYSAILREVTTDGDTARFVKTERGKFAFRK
jgi:hypothetical protein